MPALKMPPVQYEVMKLQGGLDLVTPTLSLPPGVARDAVNWEVSITGGYTRIAGYERFDGRPNPSDAQYSILTVTITGSLAVGDTIVGASSGATGVVIVVDGSTVVYTKATNAFQINEDVEVGGIKQAEVDALGGNIATNNSTAAQYLYLAGQEYRQDIQAVPGSGPIRGVVYYGGNVYAWRNNAGGTEMEIYKSSGSGWTHVPLGFELEFSTGTVEIVEGNTVTGATSGASATVTRVVLESGTWAGGDAAGRLIFASVTGTFQAAENLNVVTPCAVSGGAQSAITLLPDGRVEAVIANFGKNTRVYGVDTQNRAFEFDGTTYVPLNTGNAVDTPQHIAFHKQHLFLSFGSSVQFSAINDPYSWQALSGAGEFVVDDLVTAFQVLPGDQTTGALAVYSDDNTSVLYGTSSANFQLANYNVGTGAKPYSCQNVAIAYSFDDRGVISLITTLNYGNFDTSALTLNIRPFVQQRRNLVTASGVNREKGQYRVFFSDGYGLYLTFVNGKYMGAMPVQFPNPVTCMAEGEKPDGSETAFFGSTNGFVYRLDAGTSFDGAEISANLVLVFNSIRSPRVLKRYRKGSLEVTGTGYAEFAFSYDLGYASPEIAQELQANYETNLIASFWDQAFWDNFVWDGRTLAPSEVEVRGTAENIAVRIASISPIYQSFTVNSVILHYTMRRGLR
jgi:hypothetical protein